MKITANIEKLKSLTSSLIDNALTEVRSKRQESSTSEEEQFRISEYLLLEAKEYVDGAWEMIASKKCDASLALSRWLLEASINLLWAVDDNNKTKQRLKDIYDEALSCNATLCEGLAELWSNQALDFKKAAKEARKKRESLGVQKQERDNLNKRLKEIKKLDKSACNKLYTLYRICCAFAHPSLNVWERFTNIGNATVSKKPDDNRSIACSMAAASTLFLVRGAYILANLERKQQLNDWWMKQVEPLLNNI